MANFTTFREHTSITGQCLFINSNVPPRLKLRKELKQLAKIFIESQTANSSSGNSSSPGASSWGTSSPGASSGGYSSSGYSTSPGASSVGYSSSDDYLSADIFVNIFKQKQNFSSKVPETFKNEFFSFINPFLADDYLKDLSNSKKNMPLFEKPVYNNLLCYRKVTISATDFSHLLQVFADPSIVQELKKLPEIFDCNAFFCDFLYFANELKIKFSDLESMKKLFFDCIKLQNPDLKRSVE